MSIDELCFLFLFLLKMYLLLLCSIETAMHSNTINLIKLLFDYVGMKKVAYFIDNHDIYM